MKKLYSILLCAVIAMSSIAFAQQSFNGGALSSVKATESSTVTKKYSGLLNVSMMGDPVVVDQANTITIVENGDGTCTFILPDFRLEEGGDSMGDITVENVGMTSGADGVTTYAGTKNGLVLAGGELVVDVELAGTITATGIVDMKINVVWNGIPILCTFNGKEIVTKYYPGLLNVSMMGEPVVVDQANTITIVENGDGTCTFILPDFRLDAESESMGDITVESVTMTTDEGGITTYEGTKNGLTLAGELVVDVELAGTITAEGAVNMTIDVVWNGIPIKCTFISTGNGVERIGVSQQNEVEYYNLQGVKVANPENGVFIRVQGGKATKILK